MGGNGAEQSPHDGLPGFLNEDFGRGDEDDMPSFRMGDGSRSEHAAPQPELVDPADLPNPQPWED